jgi:uncharacterized membrane protein
MSSIESRFAVDRARLRAVSLSVPISRSVIVIAIPTLVGALLCGIKLDTRSLWVDEGATFSIAYQHGAALWQGIAHDGGNMLLYYLVVHVMIGAFGSAAWVMRLPSLLSLSLTGGLVSWLGLRLFGDRRIAVGAGLLTVVSLPLIYWGQNARGYAPMVALSTASFCAFAAILSPNVGDTPSRTAITAYVLFTLADMYVGYDAVLLIPAQLVLLFYFRARVKVVAGTLAGVAVMCIPLAVLAAERGSGQLFWVPPLSMSVAGQAAYTLTSATLPSSFSATPTSVSIMILTADVLVCALVVSLSAWWRGRGVGSRHAHWPVLLVVSWLLVPTVLGLVIYATGVPVELSRCAILLIPALALLLMWGFVHPRLPKVVGGTMFVTLFTLRLLQVTPTYGVSPEDWKGVTSSVLSQVKGKAACVAFYAQDGRGPFEYYAHSSTRDGELEHLTPVLPSAPWTTVTPYVEQYRTLNMQGATDVAKRCPRLFLIGSHTGATHATGEVATDMDQWMGLQAEFNSLYPSHIWSSWEDGAIEVTAYTDERPHRHKHR